MQKVTRRDHPHHQIWKGREGRGRNRQSVQGHGPYRGRAWQWARDRHSSNLSTRSSTHNRIILEQPPVRLGRIRLQNDVVAIVSTRPLVTDYCTDTPIRIEEPQGLQRHWSSVLRGMHPTATNLYEKSYLSSKGMC